MNLRSFHEEEEESGGDEDDPNTDHDSNTRNENLQNDQKHGQMETMREGIQYEITNN